MPSYKIFKEDKLLGHTNIASCDCAVFKQLGIDINGNTMLYDPTLHTIKECNTTVLFDPPPPSPGPPPGQWLGPCLSNNTCPSGLKCIDLSKNVVTGTVLKACVTDIYFPTPPPIPPSFWPSKSHLAHYDISNKSCKLCIDFSDGICPSDVKTLPMEECCARTGNEEDGIDGNGCNALPWIPADWCLGEEKCERRPPIDGSQSYIDCMTNPTVSCIRPPPLSPSPPLLPRRRPLK